MQILYQFGCMEIKNEGTDAPIYPLAKKNKRKMKDFQQ